MLQSAKCGLWAFTSSKPSILGHFWAEKVFGDSKNDFFQKSKNPFLGFGQSNIDSKFQDFWEKSVTSGAFTSRKPFILDHFWTKKNFRDSKNDFFKNSKKPVSSFHEYGLGLKFHLCNSKTVTWAGAYKQTNTQTENQNRRTAPNAPAWLSSIDNSPY